MSSANRAVANVGRVGALAVALGIGAAVATGTGVAWADPSDRGAGAGSQTSESRASESRTSESPDRGRTRQDVVGDSPASRASGGPRAHRGAVARTGRHRDVRHPGVAVPRSGDPAAAGGRGGGHDNQAGQQRRSAEHTGAGRRGERTGTGASSNHDAESRCGAATPGSAGSRGERGTSPTDRGRTGRRAGRGRRRSGGRRSRPGRRIRQGPRVEAAVGGGTGPAGR